MLILLAYNKQLQLNVTFKQRAFSVVCLYHKLTQTTRIKEQMYAIKLEFVQIKDLLMSDKEMDPGVSLVELKLLKKN